MVKGYLLPVTVQTPRCPRCHKTSLVQMTRAEHYRLNSGLMIQQALPDWTADKRELLITGVHPECWAEMFSDLDEDDE